MTPLIDWLVRWMKVLLALAVSAIIAAVLVLCTGCVSWSLKAEGTYQGNPVKVDSDLRVGK